MVCFNITNPTYYQRMIEFIQSFSDYQMWFSLGVIFAAIIMYANNKVSMELTSVFVISALALFYYFFPVLDKAGNNSLSVDSLFLGFSNSALITVVSLLILGQAVIQTGMLNNFVTVLMKVGGNNTFITITFSLIFVFFVSSILNNTPVVVIFIPIMAAISRQAGISVSKVMIPLSFASILGGMTTLIGSSTNLLVSGVMNDLGQGKLSFFEFTTPGMFIAGIAFVFVAIVVPMLLTDRASFVKSYSQDSDNRQFIAQIEVGYSSELVGKSLEHGHLPDFKNATVKMILRGEHAILAPFDDSIVIRPNDIIIITASKKDLTGLFAKYKDFMDKHFARLSEVEDDEDLQEDMLMAEIVVAPGSRILNQTLEQLRFHNKYDCTVLAIQRQSRMLRSRVSDIRLQAGDVLLVMGHRESIFGLQETKDFLLMEWSAESFASSSKAIPTAIIFGGAVALAGFSILPISIGSFLAVGLCLLMGCLNINQAIRAVDMRIVLIIGASLAMGTAMQATGGAAFIANELVSLTSGLQPIVILAIMFIAMAVMTNILSNNATAVLFTPIAVNLAQQLGVDVKVFVYAVIFACNCSFLTPIGYQTNLMVMGPGHYKFGDFFKSGLPIALIVMSAYLFYAWMFYF